VEGRAIEDEAVVREIAGDVDLDAQREALKRNTDEAIARGVFGAPATFLGDQLYWGEDRLWMVESALRGDVGPVGDRPEGSARTDKELNFYFDFSSPFSYLASTRVEELAARTGATLRLRPMLLGAVFRAVGQVDAPILAMNEPKRQFVLADLGRWAAHWGVPVVWPTAFPIRTVLPLRVWLRQPTAERMHAIYAAAWGRGEDVGDPAVLRSLGIPDEDIDNAATERDALVASTQSALGAGVFGAPSFVVDGRLYWGQDRLAHVEAALTGWTPPA
jgi:2-hydroxychromene-2-carboxylate isomerase